MAQLQHNMWVTHLRSAVLSIITGGGKWVEMTIPMDPLYLSVLVAAEKKFWRCVQSGETPHLINAEPPRPRIEAIRIVDMSASNSWAEFAALFRNTRERFLGPRAGQDRAQGLAAGGCQGGDRTWGARQALEVGRGELRSPGGGGQPMHRSSEVGRGTGGSARQGAGRARQSREVADRRHPQRAGRGGRTHLPLCAARRAASTSCAGRWASTRSPPCRPPPSTRRQGWSI